MAAILTSFLARAGRRGFAWGQNDCMILVADWAVVLTGRDPAAQYRDLYSNETEAMDIIARAGSPTDLLDQCLLPLGWSRVVTTIAGDIALVQPPGHSEEAAGVCVGGGRVALLSKRGLVVWPMPILTGWRHA
jgi:hypothetical protein